MRHRLVTACLFLVLLVSASASATTIVDTGPGSGDSSWVLGAPGIDQWLAAEFTTLDAYTITSIEGWIGVDVAGDVAIRLYSDGGEVPGVSLFSQTVALPTGGAAWLGAFGLNWLIGPGTYWVAFETPSGSTLSAGMQPTSGSPLLNEAFQNSGVFPYVEFDDLDIGVRINADLADATVPEPTSLLLLGSGLVGAALRGRRRLKK